MFTVLFTKFLLISFVQWDLYIILSETQSTINDYLFWSIERSNVNLPLTNNLLLFQQEMFQPKFHCFFRISNQNIVVDDSLSSTDKQITYVVVLLFSDVSFSSLISSLVWIDDNIPQACKGVLVMKQSMIVTMFYI